MQNYAPQETKKSSAEDMHYTITQGQGHLRAELFGRETVDQTLEFVGALTGAALENGARSVLVMVRNSRPIFKVDKTNIAEQFRRLAAQPAYRVALLADADELRASHEYIEILARQQGANVRAFRDEASALEWLGAAARAPQSQEKR
jgi:hypothetical protein